jgi:hypothetical protein
VPGSSSSVVEGWGGISGVASRSGRGQHGRRDQRPMALGTVGGFRDGVELGQRCRVRLGSRVDQGQPKRRRQWDK